jgi:hypothetical protein
MPLVQLYVYNLLNVVRVTTMAMIVVAEVVRIVFSFNLYFDEILCKQVIAVVEIIGIIITLVKVLVPMVIDGEVPEVVVVSQIVEVVVVFVVSYLNEKKMIFKNNVFFVGASGGGGSDFSRDGGDRGKFPLYNLQVLNYRFFSLSDGSYRGGSYRGASRGNGGSSNYSPY